MNSRPTIEFALEAGVRLHLPASPEIVVFDRTGGLESALGRLTRADDPLAVFVTTPQPPPASLARISTLLERFLPPARIVKAPAPTLLSAVIDTLAQPSAKSRKGNPFAVIGEAIEFLKQEILAEPERLRLVEVLLASESNLQPGTRAEARRKSFHGSRGFQRLVQTQVADLCTGLLLHHQRSDSATPLNILWIENRPDQMLAEVMGLEASSAPSSSPPNEEQRAGWPTLRNVASRMVEWLGAPEKTRLFLIRGSFSEFHSDLLRAEPASDLRLERWKAERLSPKEETDAPQLADIHLFLIDIYLDEDDRNSAAEGDSAGKRVDGIAIQDALERLFPGTPAIIVSSSDDYEESRRVFRNRGEYFLPKRQFLSTPLLYYRSVDELGPTLGHIQNSGLRAHVMSLVRRWSREPAYLWFGDKCYHMIDHALPHALDDWKLFNELEAVLRSNGWLELDDGEIYAMTLAVWLHDIGHKGNERHGEPHQVRDGHGIFSAEYILKRPESLDIREPASFEHDSSEAAQFDLFYKKPGDSWSTGRIAEAMLRRNPRSVSGLSMLELGALLALYHKSNAPVTESLLDRLKKNGKRIPAEYLDSKGGHVTLQAILRAAYAGDEPRVNRMLQLAFLFRLVDGLDVSKERVGREASRKLKRDVIDQDLQQTFRRLEQHVGIMGERPSVDAHRAIEELYHNVRTDIENLADPRLTERLQEMGLELSAEEEYRRIVDFARFISVQAGHFDYHGSVDSLAIGDEGFDGGKRLLLRFRLNRPYTWLEKKCVQEMGGTEISIWKKVFGTPSDLPYAIAEFRDGKEHLAEVLKLVSGVTLVIELPGDDDELASLQKKWAEDPGAIVEKIAERPGWIRARRVCRPN